MAQVNLTLTHEEVLQVLTGDRDEAMKFLLERILNEIMKAESEEQLGDGFVYRRNEDFGVVSSVVSSRLRARDGFVYGRNKAFRVVSSVVSSHLIA